MAKFILLSAVLAILVIPIAASRAKSSQKGLRWTLMGVLLFNILYVFAVRYIYPRLAE